MQPIHTDILVVGAGPVGLFTVFEAGLLGMSCHLVDNLDRPGGQCTELYPEKPIYDIPGVPVQTAQEHVDALLKQIEPFPYSLSLGERIESLQPRPAELSGEGAEELPAGLQDWVATTNTGQQYIARNLFIAAGAGAFEPRRPTGIDNPDPLLGKGVSYAVRDRARYKGKRLFIFGGGDSALDWTVELAGEAESLALVHRRDAFRGAPATEAEMRALVAADKVQLLTPYVIHGIETADGQVTGVSLRNFDSDEVVTHPCDEALFLLGLNKKLGPILEWGLDLADKKIAVDTESFQTSSEGIFAVGDINHYAGKLDLILCGFHETTLACQQAYKRLHPGERVPFGYTTSNQRLHQALGVTES